MSFIKQETPSELYYIRSLMNNKFISFDDSILKQFKLLINKKIIFCDCNYYAVDQFKFKIISIDQEKSKIPKQNLRFGEQIKITDQKDRQFMNNDEILQIQDIFQEYNSQTFIDMKDNFVNKRPCFLINKQNQYLSITDEHKQYFKFENEPQISSYFQLIPVHLPIESQQSIQFVQNNYCDLSQPVYIRNYVTGYYLDVARQGSDFVLATNQGKVQSSSWKIQKVKDQKGVDILNQQKNQYLADIEKNQKQINLVVYGPQQKWQILTPNNDDNIILGVPFLIRGEESKNYLTQQEINLKFDQQKVHLEVQIMKYSYWVIFYQKQ